jgi:hypothetical protein
MANNRCNQIHYERLHHGSKIVVYNKRQSESQYLVIYEELIPHALWRLRRRRERVDISRGLVFVPALIFALMKNI